MSLKQVITDSGVRAVFQFNPMLQNWVTAKRKAEVQGFAATAVRIGTKRVVVAIDRQVKRNRIWFPLSAIGVCLLVAVSYLLSQQSPRSQQYVAAVTCLPIQIGDEIITSDAKAIVRDWSASLVSLGSLGSLQQYEVSATCRNQVWSGQITVNAVEDHMTIKKLTPTKR